MLDPRLQPQADIDDIVDEGDVQLVHDVLQELEAVAARGDDERLIGDVALVRADLPGVLVDADHLFAKRKRDVQLFKLFLQLLDQKQASVRAKVGLPDGEQAAAELVGPFLVDFDIRLVQELRLQEFDHLVQILVRGLLVPVFGREADGVGEVHLAVVAHAAGRVLFLVQHQYGQLGSALLQAERHAHARRAAAHDHHIILVHRKSSAGYYPVKLIKNQTISLPQKQKSTESNWSG